ARTEVLPLPNGSQARPTRGAKSWLGVFAISSPKGEVPGVQFTAVLTFCELTNIPLQKLPVPATRLPAPVTSGALEGEKSKGSKFDKRPFLSLGWPKRE